MTGFGRTGPVFACQKESVWPDLMAVAKGMTGGYLPMAATLVVRKIFDAFLGRYDEFKTFFHGHSYTANQLGAAASLASLRLLESKSSIRARGELESAPRGGTGLPVWSLPNVGDTSGESGIIVGVELVRDWKTRGEPFSPGEQAGIRVCDAMSRRGVSPVPCGNVIVVMPPYCTTPSQARRIILGVARQR